MMTGRTQAKANQVDVRISLQPRGGESNQGHASIQPARPRVEPISNIDPVEEETSDEARSAGKINTEDLEPPADEAASLAPRRNVRLSRASGRQRCCAGSRRLELAAGPLEQSRCLRRQATGFRRRRGPGDTIAGA